MSQGNPKKSCSKANQRQTRPQHASHSLPGSARKHASVVCPWRQGQGPCGHVGGDVLGSRLHGRSHASRGAVLLQLWVFVCRHLVPWGRSCALLVVSSFLASFYSTGIAYCLAYGTYLPLYTIKLSRI